MPLKPAEQVVAQGAQGACGRARSHRLRCRRLLGTSTGVAAELCGCISFGWTCSLPMHPSYCGSGPEGASTSSVCETWVTVSPG